MQLRSEFAAQLNVQCGIPAPVIIKQRKKMDRFCRHSPVSLTEMEEWMDGLQTVRWKHSDDKPYTLNPQPTVLTHMSIQTALTRRSILAEKRRKKKNEEKEKVKKKIS